jgi:hypothetical protein
VCDPNTSRFRKRRAAGRARTTAAESCFFHARFRSIVPPGGWILL